MIAFKIAEKIKNRPDYHSIDIVLDIKREFVECAARKRYFCNFNFAHGYL